MTYEEAIKAIQVDGVVHATEESVSIEMSHSKMGEFYTGLRVAEEALEKQTPKKPINIYPVGYDPVCPNCARKFGDDQYDHCPRCGQALTWR